MRRNALIRCGMRYSGFLIGFLLLLASCSLQRQIGRSAFSSILDHPALKTAHIGISVFDPDSKTFLYEHQGDKYFVPASNVKIATCYAAMNHLGDSIPGILYRQQSAGVLLIPTADPTFLHPDFREQKVYEWLKAMQQPLFLNMDSWKDEPWGSGWLWNDFEEPYMAERSAMPVYGNVVRIDSNVTTVRVVPSFFTDVQRLPGDTGYLLSVQRKLAANTFFVGGGAPSNQVFVRSFHTNNGQLIYDLLSDTLKRSIQRDEKQPRSTEKFDTIFSHPTDAVLRPMMHESDNFLAEQALMMVSHKLLGEMNDARLIDSLLKTDLGALPQRPRWADGSGLSRYNLFSPRDFVWLLAQMRQQFGMQRIADIFPTGNEGTLAQYYKSDSGFIYAKTGTLSGVVALSGFLYTRKKRLLIFSILVNNHQAGPATLVRRAMESFLGQLRSRY